MHQLAAEKFKNQNQGMCHAYFPTTKYQNI